MIKNLCMVVNNTKNTIENNQENSERLLKSLLDNPCSFSDNTFHFLITIFKQHISLKEYDKMFKQRMDVDPDRNTLFNRALMATMSDSTEADLLIAKLKQIRKIGLIIV